ncbi:hypothetical protein NQZ68_014346 [Dissostichus eleginoides]|nr:hypothetical protein NQZ68_014346 [Dissostichus eleginoides]
MAKVLIIRDITELDQFEERHKSTLLWGKFRTAIGHNGKGTEQDEDLCCGDVVSVSCFRTAVSGARPRDFVVLPACRSLHNSAGFQCVITRRKPHED